MKRYALYGSSLTIPATVFVCALSMLSGCGGAPPVREPISPLYTALADEFTAFDFDVLRGKKILIDPGHGGRFTGTTGQDGLEEKSVNLGVSLYLWGLLKEAGADAYLTRAADRDFLVAQAESDLTRDLAARVALSDSLDPDLFLSVHHNARGDTNRAFNQIEVYYPMADDGPSRDAAHAIFHHLKRNLGEAKGRVIPGNFYVLRENDAPAVLGESSYLSHPPVEEKLKLSDIQRLEAEAYFLGITRYFMSGAPRAWFVAESGAVASDAAGSESAEGDTEQSGAGFVRAAPRDTIRSVDAFHVQAVVRDEDGFAGIDPSTIELTLDGKPLAHRFLPGSDRVQAALPYDIANAEHELTLRARNLNGNSTKIARRGVLVDLPVDPDRVYGLAGSSTTVLAIPDSRGLAVRDQIIQIGDPIHRNTYQLQSGTVRIDDRGYQTRGDPLLSLLVADQALEISLDSFPRFDRVDILEKNQPIWQNDSLAFADPFGLAGLSGRDHSWKAGTKLFGAAPGVVVDMEIGPRLFRPCGRNALRLVANQVRSLFDWYGPGAVFSHTDDVALAPAVRIRSATQNNALLWITLQADTCYRVTHFPGSRLGEPVARSIAARIFTRLGVQPQIETGTVPVLRDTPCPAVIVQFPLRADCTAEESADLHALALAIAEAVLPSYLSEEDRIWDETEQYTELVVPGLKRGDLVHIDPAGVTLQSSRDGDYSFHIRRWLKPPGFVWVRSGKQWKRGTRINGGFEEEPEPESRLEP